jgi:hypothetical protein
MIQQQLDKYINEPQNPLNNYWLAWEYEKQGHNAAALSYYLRCAELSEDKDLVYECLLKTWYVVSKSKKRPHFEHKQLLTAISQHPKRPEAYFILSRYHELKNEWKDCYYYASVGLELCDFNLPKTLTDVSYPGNFSLFFQKALSSWYVGQRQDSKEMYRQLSEDPSLTPPFRQAVINNLKFFKIINYDNPLSIYTPKEYSNLKLPFKGSNKIEKNYSQVMQDIFTLSVLNGKTDGTYIEIGSGDPFYGNNTALLEELGWKGVSIDIEPNHVKKFNELRKNICFQTDATTINYTELFEDKNLPSNIDYLSLDCDPPEITYDILTKLPLDDYKFAVITYEHDYWNDTERKYQLISQEYLISKGYELVINNVGANENQPFEDWYVHPDLIDMKRVKKIKNISNKTKLSKDILLKS